MTKKVHHTAYLVKKRCNKIDYSDLAKVSCLNTHYTSNYNDVIKENETSDNAQTSNSSLGVVSGCDSIKTTWDIRECFKQLRFDKNHHLGLGDIRLTIAQQEEICDLVERFYRCR